jgi:hypothetical protein
VDLVATIDWTSKSITGMGTFADYAERPGHARPDLEARGEDEERSCPRQAGQREHRHHSELTQAHGQRGPQPANTCTCAAAELTSP